MTLPLRAYRFQFRAVESLSFPDHRAGNVFRGALGLLLRGVACSAQCRKLPAMAELPASCSTCPYSILFEPVPHSAPSGLKKPPKPLVLRAAHLNGRQIAGGDSFQVAVHLFCDPALVMDALTRAFDGVSKAGLGTRRNLARLISVERFGPVELPLAERSVPFSRLTIRFATPTELKGVDFPAAPPFDLLMARIRDRVSTLAHVYGGAGWTFDYAGFAQRASSVSTVRSDLKWVTAERRSSRSGAVHSIGGFIGEVEYEGNFGEFLPWLEAAFWTGVGRHTVWGNGMLVTRPATERNTGARPPVPGSDSREAPPPERS